VLIVTRRFDPHADVVVVALERLGVGCLRLNTEDMLDALQLSWRAGPGSRGSLHLQDGFGRSLEPSALAVAGYYRTPGPVLPATGLESSPARSFASSEGEALLTSLLAASGIRWLSSPDRVLRAAAKLPQIELAGRLGLAVPPTLVTNRPEEAYEFAREHDFDVIVKPMATPSFERGDRLHDVFTRRLTQAELLCHLEAVRLAPTMLQAHISKRAEVRVTIVGEEVFAVALDSQSVPGAELDWRRVGPATIEHTVVALPEALVSKLHRFLECCGLRFGAIDLIETPEGDFVFLENNPSGAWYWLEQVTGLPMTHTLAHQLSGLAGQGAGAAERGPVTAPRPAA